MILCCCAHVNAGFTNAKDSNIVINAAKDVFEFVYDKSSNSVQVKEEISMNYLCNNYRSTIQVVQFYNDKNADRCC
jgi:hypothetical protein